MSKVVEFPRKEPVYEQASVWIARLDRGLTTDEEQSLAQWVRQNTEHRHVLFEMAALWDKMDSLARLADLFDAPTQVKPRAPVAAYAIAACFVVAAFALAWSLNLFTLEASDLNARYYTAVGERSTINLPDGSLLVLNTNSQISIHYTAEHRLLFLEQGEVHIEVAHDAARPLSVIAGDKVVQAVGTAFNVKMYNNREVELLVTDGKVRVAEHASPAQTERQAAAQRLPESALAISRGEKIVLGSKQEKIAKVMDVDIAAQLSWRDGNLIFRGETLEQALAEISRYTSVTFEVIDDRIKHERIAGLFKAGDVDGLLATLTRNFNIDSERLDDNKILLRAR